MGGGVLVKLLDHHLGVVVMVGGDGGAAGGGAVKGRQGGWTGAVEGCVASAQRCLVDCECCGSAYHLPTKS